MLIIKPRMPRVLGTRRRVGQFGARSLQRSMIHVRRMLISRLPERLSEDLQQAAEQPLGWDELPALTEPSQGPIVEAPRRTRSQPSQPVQRSAASSRESSNTMPHDLQAIFEGHKRMGRVQSSSDLKSQAEVFNKSGGAILPEPEEPAQSAQRAAEEKSIPASEPRRRQVRSKVEYVNRPDPDMVRRSREASDVQREVEDISVDEAALDEEYDFVNTFPPDEEQHDFDAPTDFYSEGYDDHATGSYSDVQRAIGRAEAPVQRDEDTPSDAYAETYIEHDADSYDEAPRDLDDPSATRQSIQRAVDRAEAPLRRDVDMPADAYSETYTDRDVDIYDEAPRDVDDAATTQQSIQRAVDRAEASVQRDIDTASDAYSESYSGYDDSEAPRDVDDPAATQQSIQRAVDRAEAPLRRDVDAPSDAYAESYGDYDTMPQYDELDTDSYNESEDDATAIQRAIEAAESPPESYPTLLDYQSDTQPTSTHDTTPMRRDADTDTDAIDRQLRQHRMTISDPQPPTQIQRTSLPQNLSVEADVYKSPDYEEDYATDEFIYDDYNVSPEATIQPARDDTQRYTEQDIDLSEALFGGEQDVQRRPIPEHDGPTPTLMPPIGKLRHTRPVSEQSMPRQVARRTDRDEDQEISPLDLMRMASASVDADIARDEAIRAAERPSSVQMSRDEDDSGPDDHEAQLLTLLDLPADTPIQREGPPMPTPATSTVQRELQDEGGNVEGEAPVEGESGKSLDEQAQEVYDILKRKLRIENERYKGKK
ncbi:MAG: hypothetical protein L0154_24530 [Chloroflexi bacterium]|nr:hypothetical protein [Chloroflexota bacterium]